MRFASVTQPDGDETNYTYNSQGQLTGESQNGGALALSFAYNIGELTVTNALQDTTTLYFDNNADLVRLIDPLEDHSGNLRQLA